MLFAKTDRAAESGMFGPDDLAVSYRTGPGL